MDERDWMDESGDEEKANLLANMNDLLAKYNELVEEYPDIREALGGIL